MGRGVNILGADPLWRNIADAHFKERHFSVIHDGGFQTVRANLAAFRHMNVQNELDPAWLSTLDWVVKNARANNLSVILDEHDYGRMATNAAGNTPRLLAFWKQVGEQHKDQPNSVVFELLNEPNGQLDSDSWNALSKWPRRHSQHQPDAHVIIGPAFWNNVHYLDKLELPPDDHHIIVTVHYYLPMEFTHQERARSAKTANLSGITWGTDAEKKTVETDFDDVQNGPIRRNAPSSSVSLEATNTATSTPV